MANAGLRLAENAPGDFFVDSTCIDCDACRQIAPETFAEAEKLMQVTMTDAERQQAAGSWRTSA
jgi:ferredoxin